MTHHPAPTRPTRSRLLAPSATATRFGDHGDGAAEEPRRGASEDPDRSQTTNAILDSTMTAMYETLEKAMTSTLAQMQATQDRRDREMQQRQGELTRSLALSM